MKILVTGATGFVGKKLCHALSEQTHEVIAVTRGHIRPSKNITFVHKSLTKDTDWVGALKGVDVVVHLAGRAHVMNDASVDPYQAYAEVNIDATRQLATQAALSGVKRFIYLSSVKVNGERTSEAAFNETNIPQPEDDYGKTKCEAEKVLMSIAEETGLEVVIIRPPLVYGEGVKANFKNLIQLAQLNIPLPFGRIANKRSFIFIENLIDFIMLCMHHPNAANQIFLISDDDDISTTESIRYIRTANNQKIWLIPMPKKWLILMFKMIGKVTVANRLCQNLQVDINKAKTLLGWKPRFNAQEGITKTIQSKS